MLKSLFAALSLVASFALHAADPHVEMRTNMGTIVLELYPKNAPQTVQNFLQYVKDGHYNGTIFHRVIPGFMIQGGGFTAEMREKPTREPIKNEAPTGMRNAPGTIAMARTAEPHSATAQFFINLVENPALDFRGATQKDWGYAVFGRVIKGMEVVQRIGKVPTGTRPPHGDVPLKPVVIEHVRVLETGKPVSKKD
jgi:cyclophilin family peptidyl-prolyl cis-trans isomerase